MIDSHEGQKMYEEEIEGLESIRRIIGTTKREAFALTWLLSPILGALIGVAVDALEDSK